MEHSIDELIGKTFKSVEQIDGDLILTENDDTKWKFTHLQDCCEGVSIEDINGNLEDLVGTQLIVAEERISNEHPEDISENDEKRSSYNDSFTWTFYTFRTIKGTVTIRWYGESNGYYSESVDLVKQGEYGF